MRPVRKGSSPIGTDYDDYTDAKVDLVSRLGPYCSYCERRINTNLAVEHIQPKGLSQYEHLKGSWDNFLLACVNCNSSKGDDDVQFSDFLLPDRDNTFAAFDYFADGDIKPSALAVQTGLENQAKSTLDLVGLDKSVRRTLDANGKQVALDKKSQLIELWAIAEDTKNTLKANPRAKSIAINLAKAEGFFSIWMTVFKNDPDMKNRLIDAFSGTRESGCFDPTGASISPAPNPDGLSGGRKI